jgi:prepilin-type processing-associated H-X9-DG protein
MRGRSELDANIGFCDGHLGELSHLKECADQLASIDHARFLLLAPSRRYKRPSNVLRFSRGGS